MFNFRASSSSSSSSSLSKQKSKEEQGTERKIDEVEDNLEKEIMSFSNTEPSAAAAAATSSSVNINRHNRTYTIRPEEYSVIEEDITSDWNPNDAFSEVCENRMNINKSYSTATATATFFFFHIEYTA
jgi:hypothetical protein